MKRMMKASHLLYMIKKLFLSGFVSRSEESTDVFNCLSNTKSNKSKNKCMNISDCSPLAYELSIIHRKIES